MGTASITAALSGVQGSASLGVDAALLVSMAVTPATVSMPNGTTQQLTETGTFSDLSTKNITKTVTWTSTSPSTVAVSNAARIRRTRDRPLHRDRDRPCHRSDDQRLGQRDGDRHGGRAQVPGGHARLRLRSPRLGAEEVHGDGHLHRLDHAEHDGHRPLDVVGSGGRDDLQRGRERRRGHHREHRHDQHHRVRPGQRDRLEVGDPQGHAGGALVDLDQPGDGLGPQGVRPAVHGDGALQRRLHAGPDDHVDVEGDVEGGHHLERRRDQRTWPARPRQARTPSRP